MINWLATNAEPLLLLKSLGVVLIDKSFPITRWLFFALTVSQHACLFSTDYSKSFSIF